MTRFRIASAGAALASLILSAGCWKARNADSGSSAPAPRAEAGSPRIPRADRARWRLWCKEGEPSLQIEDLEVVASCPNDETAPIYRIPCKGPPRSAAMDGKEVVVVCPEDEESR